MMKKTCKIIYVVLIVIVMLVPFAGMTFFKTDTTTENKRMAEMLSLIHISEPTRLVL